MWRTERCAEYDFFALIVERNLQKSSRNAGHGVLDGAKSSPLTYSPSICRLIRLAAQAPFVPSEWYTWRPYT